MCASYTKSHWNVAAPVRVLLHRCCQNARNTKRVNEMQQHLSKYQKTENQLIWIANPQNMSYTSKDKILERQRLEKNVTPSLNSHRLALQHHLTIPPFVTILQELSVNSCQSKPKPPWLFLTRSEPFSSSGSPVQSIISMLSVLLASPSTLVSPNPSALVSLNPSTTAHLHYPTFVSWKVKNSDDWLGTVTEVLTWLTVVEWQDWWTVKITKPNRKY